MKNNLRKILFLLLVLGLSFLFSNNKNVEANTIIASGNCGNEGYTHNNFASASWGDNATWTLNTEGVLTISGTGGVQASSHGWSYDDGPTYYDCPWYVFKIILKK